MNSRQLVHSVVTFQGMPRLAYDLPPEYGTDFHFSGMTPSPDDRPHSGRDEWGALWDNIGICRLGEVKDFPLKSWGDLASLRIPDITLPARWHPLAAARKEAGDKFFIAWGISIYERIHFLRGLENTWIDIHHDRAKLCSLIDTLVDMNLYAIDRYARIGADGFMFCDDWGLQDRLMIDPILWREIWKPRYAKIYSAAHKAGLLTFLHSCGYIVDILDDLIESGLDVIHMDQQLNMGLDLLSNRFRGRIAFWCPVDIQTVMQSPDANEIRAYCHQLVRRLATPKGGFMVKYYCDPAGAGHSPQAICAMSEEFLDISANLRVEF